jgi:DNA-binding transcriptional regulator YdaS (Cro superfamily)
MKKTAAEIVKILGGVNATARFFGLKPPSVNAWVKVGVVPDERLIPKAASIETISKGAFSRAAQFPDSYREIWPEMAGATATQQEPAHA